MVSKHRVFLVIAPDGTIVGSGQEKKPKKIKPKKRKLVSV